MLDSTVYKYLQEATSDVTQPKVFIDLNKDKSVIVTGSLVSLENARTSINENATTYTLYPYELNDPPVITSPISEASNPKILNDTSWSPDKKAMYLNARGSITIAAGSKIELKVQASQPEVLNVENGIPVLKPSDQELVYEWSYNGNNLADQVTPTLKLDPVQLTHAGSYSCTISNDIGTTTTTAVSLEVYDPNYTESEVFNKNLVENALGLSAADNWTAAVGSVQPQPLATKGIGRDLSDHIKQYKVINSVQNTGYTSEMLTPNPSSIDFVSIKEKDSNAYFSYRPLQSGLANLITRGPLVYGAKGGNQTNVIYQDIDLTDAQDYIAGRVWGVDGVKAYFSCYLANSVSRFIPTKDFITKEQRTNLPSYYLESPRLTPENTLIAGGPAVDEKLSVYVQEFHNGQLLQSSILDLKTLGVVQTYTPMVIDPLTAALNEVKQQGLAGNPLYTKDGLFQVKANTQFNEVLQAYKLLYNNEQEYYNHGQVVTHNEIIFEKLNPLTNKIRITLISDLGGVRFLEDAPDIVTREKMLENVSWERVVNRATLDTADWILAEFGKLTDYKDKPAAQCMLDASTPRAGATGFVLALHPIATNSVLTISNETYYMGVRRFGFDRPIHTPETNVLVQDKPYSQKLIPSIDTIKTFKLSLIVDRDPRIATRPSWAPFTSSLDYTNTWSAEIQTFKKDIFTSEYTKITEFFNSSNRDATLPFGENYNQFNFGQDIALNNASSVVEGYAFDLRDVQVPPVLPRASTAKVDFTNYPQTVLIKPSNFSNGGPRLTDWANSDMQAYWRWAVKNPRTRYSTHYKTFRVEFDMYHANSDNSIDLVGSCTKYLVANKKIDLYFKDFFTESQAAQKEFINKNFAGDRRAFIVVKSYTQAYKFPIRREDATGTKPPATLDGVGSDDLYDSFQSYRTTTPNTGLTDFLLYTDSAKTDVLIYEYEIVHNKTKSTI
tara:strand:+ start:5879 stop:8731 length:2853 start_codon:yes stop_codon:yes gene_type:complete